MDRCKWTCWAHIYSGLNLQVDISIIFAQIYSHTSKYEFYILWFILVSWWFLANFTSGQWGKWAGSNSMGLLPRLSQYKTVPQPAQDRYCVGFGTVQAGSVLWRPVSLTPLTMAPEEAVSRCRLCENYSPPILSDSKNNMLNLE